MAFAYCDSLKSVKIPDSVTAIGDGAFSYCPSLISVTIPNSVTNIESRMFMACNGLKSVKIPNSVTSIEDEAFAWCKSMKSIVIPESVASIGESAFFICDNLSSITIKNPDCDIFDRESTIPRATDGSNACFKGTIYGYAGSTAQEYAEKYGYKFEAITLGDVNSDGAVNAIDASLVLTEYSAIATGKNSIFNDGQKVSADVNNDGAVNALDASNILGYYSFTATGGKETLAEYLNK